MLRTTLLCLAVALVAAVPASARKIVVKASLAPGKLKIAAAPTAVPAGAQRAISVRVTDARGTGRGWTLRFAGGTGLTVTSITARCARGSTCTLPRAVSAPRAATVLRAAPDTGMGVVELIVTVRAAAKGTAAFAIS